MRACVPVAVMAACSSCARGEAAAIPVGALDGEVHLNLSRHCSSWVLSDGVPFEVNRVTEHYKPLLQAVSILYSSTAAVQTQHSHGELRCSGRQYDDIF